VSNNDSSTTFADGAFRWNGTAQKFQYFLSGSWTDFVQDPVTIDPTLGITITNGGSGVGQGVINLTSPSTSFGTTSVTIRAGSNVSISNIGTLSSPILSISSAAGTGGQSKGFSNIVINDGAPLVAGFEDTVNLNLTDDFTYSIDGATKTINLGIDPSAFASYPTLMNFLGSRITYSSNWLHPSNQLAFPNKLGPNDQMRWGADYLTVAQDAGRYEPFRNVLSSAWRPDINPTKGGNLTTQRISAWGWPQNVSSDKFKYQKEVMYVPLVQNRMGVDNVYQTAKTEYDFPDFQSPAPAVSNMVTGVSILNSTGITADSVTGRPYVIPAIPTRAPAVLNKIKSVANNDNKIAFYRVSVVAYGYVSTLLGSPEFSLNQFERYTGLGSPIPIHTAVMVYDSTIQWGDRIPSTAPAFPFYSSYVNNTSDATYSSPVIYSYLSTHTREFAPAQFNEGLLGSQVVNTGTTTILENAGIDDDYTAINSVGDRNFVSSVSFNTQNQSSQFNSNNTVLCNHVIKVESSDIVPLRFNEMAEVAFVMEKKLSIPGATNFVGSDVDSTIYNPFNIAAGDPLIGLRVVRAGINMVYAHVNFELIGVKG
jgi:hypothetical protein